MQAAKVAVWPFLVALLATSMEFPVMGSPARSEAGTWSDAVEGPRGDAAGTGDVQGSPADAATIASETWWDEQEALERDGGTYDADGAALRGRKLLLCSAGRYSCSAFSCCNCPGGRYSPNRINSCRDCPCGSYAGSGSSSCSSCPSGKYSGSKASSCSSCPGGKYGSGGCSCSSCTYGKYSSSGASSCTSCPAGRFQDSTGQSSCKYCPCGKTSSSTGQRYSSACSNCPSGRISNSARTSCSSCPGGKYASSCDTCTDCPAGKYSNGASAASCRTCPAGYYCGARSTWATECGGVTKYCSSGVSSPSNVPTGYYSSPTSSSVNRRSTATRCQPGYYCSSGVRYSCPSGRYTVNYGSTSCQTCSCDTCQSCTASTGACPLKSGWCRISGPGCVAAGTTKYSAVTSSRSDPNSRCAVCVSGGTTWSAAPTGTACDDFDLDTRSDVCTTGGICVGTPLNCLSGCQQGDGTRCVVNNGGCVTNGACGCLIGQTCYADGAVNPVNQCQHCDVSASPTSWTNRGSISCNDGDSCTHSDRCSGSTCRGTSYTCSLASCEQLAGGSATLCDGNGGCNKQNRPSSYRCRPSLDACTPSVYCTGSAGSCPAYRTTVPTVTVSGGSGVAFADSAERYTASASTVLRPDGQWRVVCGDFTWKFGAYVNPEQDPLDSSGCYASGAGVVWSATSTTSALSSSVSHALSPPISSGQGIVGVIAVRGMDESQPWVYKCTPSGRVVDTSAPISTNADVRDVAANSGNSSPDLDYICPSGDRTEVYVQWGGFSDEHSPLDALKVQVGTSTSSPSDVVVSAEFGIASAQLAIPLPGDEVAVDGTRLIVGVSARNAAGLWSTTVSSDGALYDCSSPVAATSVSIVAAPAVKGKPQISYQTTATSIAFTFSPATDPHSGLAKYSFGVGTSSSATVMTGGWLDLGVTETVRTEAAGLSSLMDGVAYRVTLRAFNNVPGVAPTESVSNFVVVDTTAPFTSGAVVADLVEPTASTTVSSESDIDYQSLPAPGNSLGWGVAGVVEPHSGPVRYEVCVGSAADDCDVLDWGLGDVAEAEVEELEGAGGVLAPNGTVSGFSLSHGHRYFVRVRATNRAGLWATLSSDGVLMDATPPASTQFVDGGTLSDRAYQSEVDTLACGWSLNDPESGLTGQVSISARRVDGGLESVVLPAETVDYSQGAFSEYRKTGGGLVLVHGATYVMTLAAENRAGLTAQFHSNGVTVDTTAPEFGAVQDGFDIDTDLDFKTVLTQIEVAFAVDDDVSGISTIVWRVSPCDNPSLTVHHQVLGASARRARATGKSNMALGVAYCSTITATNGAALSASKTSDGVSTTVDVPTPGVVLDGTSGPDRRFQASLSEAAAHWSGFSDSASGIKHYLVSLGTASQPTALVDSENVGLATSWSRNDLELESGSVIYVRVTAVNNVDLSSSATSDGVVVDNTSPEAGSVVIEDPDAGAATDWLTSTTFMRASWSGFEHSAVPITEFSWSIIDSAGGPVLPSVSVGTQLNAEAAGLTLSAGAEYRVVVVATAANGVSTTAVSSAARVDDEGPTMGAVSADLLAPTRLLITYTAADTVSGVSEYLVAVGTSPGGTQVRGFVEAPATGELELADIFVPDGSRLYAAAMARDASGQLSPVATASVVTYDASPPTPGRGVSDGLNGPKADDEFQTSPTIVSASWDGFEDVHTGVATYAVGWGTQPGSFDVSDLTVVEGGSAARSFSLTLSAPVEPGAKIYATVVATNPGGGSSSQSSNGVTIDDTPPVGGTVSLAQVGASWDGFRDAESLVAGFDWCAGSATGTCDLQGWEDAGPTLSISSDQVFGLMGSGTIVVAVRARNRAGLVGEAAWSSAFVQDPTPPRRGDVSVVTPTPGFLAAPDGQLPELSVRWHGFDDDDTGVLSVRWAVGTVPGGQQVVAASDAPAASAAGSVSSSDVVSLHDGAELFASVVVTNGAGSSVSAFSLSAVIVDHSRPVATRAAVSITTGSEQMSTDYIGPDTELGCGWRGFADPGSGIVAYEVGLFSSPCDTSSVDEQSVANWTRFEASDTADRSDGFAGSLEHVVSFEGSLSSFVAESVAEVVCKVRAINGAGMTGPAACSPATINEASPPSGGQVVSQPFQAHDDGIRVEWQPFSAASGVATYEVAVASSSGGVAGEGDIVPFAPVPLSGSSWVALSLEDGKAYYPAVRATSNAGASSVVWGSAVRVDSAPPLRGDVYDRAGPGQQLYVDTNYTSSTTTLSASWDGFTAGVSGIVRYLVGAGPSAGSLAVPLTPVGIATEATLTEIDPPLVPGQRYYVTVVAVSGAGLRVSAVSDGAVVDDSPAQIDSVRFGGAAALRIAVSQLEHGSQCEWVGLQDIESGVLSMTVSVCMVGDNDGVDDVLAVVRPDVDSFVDSEGSASVTVDATTWEQVPDAARIVCRVAVTNGAGAETVAQSLPVVKDATPPTVGAVVVDWPALEAEGSVGISAPIIAASWRDFEDLESGIVSCEYSVVHASDHGVVVPWQPAQQRGLAGIPANASWTDALQVAVRCSNAAGSLSETAWSADVMQSLQKPGHAGIAVADVGFAVGGTDADFTSSTTTLAAAWDATAFPQDVPELVLSWAIGTVAGGADVLGLRSVPEEAREAGSVSSIALHLTHASTYFITLVALDHRTALARVISSNGITVDETPPRHVGGRRGVFVTPSQSDTTALFTSWHPFEDPDSDLVEVVVRVVRSSDLQEAGYPDQPTEVPVLAESVVDTTAENATISGLQLVHGERYACIVRATNGAGSSTWAFSGDVLVDTTPPVPSGAVVDLGDAEALSFFSEMLGTSAASGLVEVGALGDSSLLRVPSAQSIIDAACQRSNSTVGAAWSFVDEESGVAEYEWQVRVDGESAGPFQPVGTRTWAFAEGMLFTNGTVVGVAVRARSAAGVWSDPVASNGVRVTHAGASGACWSEETMS